MTELAVTEFSCPSLSQIMHSHVWVHEHTTDMGAEVMRIEDACACGATRVRVGYRWERRRSVWARRSSGQGVARHKGSDSGR